LASPAALIGDRKQCDQLDEAINTTRHGDAAKTSATALPTVMQRHGCGDGGIGQGRLIARRHEQRAAAALRMQQVAPVAIDRERDDRIGKATPVPVEIEKGVVSGRCLNAKKTTKIAI
jgi:hypothetical protein